MKQCIGQDSGSHAIDHGDGQDQTIRHRHPGLGAGNPNDPLGAEGGNYCEGGEGYPIPPGIDLRETEELPDSPDENREGNGDDRRDVKFDLGWPILPVHCHTNPIRKEKEPRSIKDKKVKEPLPKSPGESFFRPFSGFYDNKNESKITLMERGDSSTGALCGQEEESNEGGGCSCSLPP